jgi:hypothetical protein
MCVEEWVELIVRIATESSIKRLEILQCTGSSSGGRKGERCFVYFQPIRTPKDSQNEYLRDFVWKFGGEDEIRKMVTW